MFTNNINVQSFRPANCARWLVGLIFFFGGALKFTNPVATASSIEGFGIVPTPLVFPLAMWLPFLEMVPGGACLFKATARPALLLVALLAAIFMAAIVQAMMRGLEVNCGCFGNVEWLNAPPSIALFRNSLLILLSVCVYSKLVNPHLGHG